MYHVQTSSSHLGTRPRIQQSFPILPVPGILRDGGASPYVQVHDPTKNLSYFLSGIGQQFTMAPSKLLDVEVRLTLG